MALINCGAKIDAIHAGSGRFDGTTPLHNAAENGHTKVVQALLKSGAQVDKEDNGGQTPLLYAAWRGHAEVVQTLLIDASWLCKPDRET
jgi:ankyrin repeat protein